jgi:hypothetical protein
MIAEPRKGGTEPGLSAGFPFFAFLLCSAGELPLRMSQFDPEPPDDDWKCKGRFWNDKLPVEFSG